MFETAGQVTVAEPAPLLLLLLFLPLAAALGGRGSSRALLLGALSTLTVALYFAVRIALLPEGHAFAWHVADVARFGTLDLAVDVLLDRPSALVACTVALVSAADAFASLGKEAGRASAALLTTGLMIAALSDGFGAFFVGVGIAALATLSGTRSAKAVVATATTAGAIGALFGAFVLFGAVGPIEETRSAALAVVATDGAGTGLSMSTLAGAQVTTEDGPALPGEPLISPFRVDVEPATYSLRVTTGAASDEAHLAHVTIAKDHHYVLAPFGPTTSFRTMADEARVPRPGATAALSIFRQGRLLFGLPGADVGLLLLALAALVQLLGFAANRSATTIGAALVLPPVVLALRTFVALDPASTIAMVIASAGAIASVILAGNAAASEDGATIVRHVVASAGAAAITAVAIGEPGGALALVTTSTLLGAGTLAALQSASDIRWLGIAAAGLSGLLPVAGASAGQILTFAAILHLPIASRAAVATLLTIAWGLSSIASFRLYDARFGRRSGDGPQRPAVHVLVLVLGGSALGVVLGVGAAMFGGQALPLAQAIATPASAVTPSGALAGFAASLASALVGLVLARKADRAQAAGIPARLLLRAAERIGGAFLFLGDGVMTMEHLVVDDATSAAGDAVGSLARVVLGFDRALERSTESVVVRPLSALIERADLDDPRKSARIGLGLSIAMVGLLGLVVLFSLFAR